MTTKNSVKHSLDAQTARRATEKAWESYAQRFAKYRPWMRWATAQRADVGFTVKGLELKGALELGEAEIGMELEVPFVFLPFKRKAISIIEQEIRRWVAKAEAGEL